MRIAPAAGNQVPAVARAPFRIHGATRTAPAACDRVTALAQTLPGHPEP